VIYKAVICVVIYNRLKNLKRWLEIWDKLNLEDVELRIIHNVHPENNVEKFREYIGDRKDVKYIPRQNVGYDIGAFQDVCRNRLRGFNYDFKYLLWFTDDTMPIRREFLDYYLKPFSDPKVGCICYEISPQVKKHIRTTGFCLPIETLPKIQFETNQIKTKDDCYRFEHRSLDKTLLNQITKMGLEYRQIAPIKSSPIYDTESGGMQWTDRTKEFLRYWEFEMPPSKVAVIAPAFIRYPTITASMLNQTYENWELHLVHAGSAPHDYPRFKDDRIKFFETFSNRKNWGHPIRVDWLNKVKSKEIVCDYVVITNDDNYHVPHYLEKLIKPLEEDENLIGSFCSRMVHNYAGTDGYNPSPEQIENIKQTGHVTDGYGIIECEGVEGYIDCASAMIRSELAGACGWPSMRHSSDWDYLNNITKKYGGWQRMKKVAGCLMVHN
jgi:GT2 family glycosyltransferase